MGETITVGIDEVTFHPGHYRVVRSAARRSPGSPRRSRL
jgi:hypothetical protein